MAAEGSALGSLVSWANGQESWTRAIVSDVLATGAGPDDAACRAVAEQYLVEKALAEGERRVAPLLGSPDATLAGTESLRLESISGCHNVNALAEGQRIDFHPQITVLMGENGSGKSGYVRVLKRVASVRSAEAILPNVHENRNEPPEADISYSVGSHKVDVHWTGEAGLSPLDGISVFDARALKAHLDDRVPFAHTPGELVPFKLVNSAIQAVREVLRAKAAERDPGANQFVGLFRNDTPLYSTIEELGASSDLDALEKLATLSEAEDAQMYTLGATIAALTGSSGAATAEVLRTRLVIANHLQVVVSGVARFDSGEFEEAATRLLAAEADQTRAARATLPREELPEDVLDAWLAFLMAGNQFVTASGHEHYPDDGDVCVYCRQALDPEARRRVDGYRAFTGGVAAQEVFNANGNLSTATGELTSPDVTGALDSLSTIFEGLPASEDEPSWLAKGRAFAEAVRLLRSEVEARIVPSTVDVVTSSSRLASQLSAVESEMDSAIRALSGSEAERVTELRDAQSRLALLEQRTLLATHWDRIRQYAEAAKWKDRLETLLGSFQGLLASLTRTANEASEALVRRRFAAAFEAERAILDAPYVSVAFPGAEGRSERHKTVADGLALSKILSEGQQKAIALADFLAEASLAPSDAPIVFDDPVTSLDYRRVNLIAGRIATLSEIRQVVVFTHDGWFAAELLSALGDRECAFYDVRADVDGIGLVSRAVHPRLDTPGKLKARINTTLQNARGAFGDQRKSLLVSAYDYMRAWCESYTESKLLGNVTRRFQQNISIDRLTDIRTENLRDAINVILPVYHKACRYIEAHARPVQASAIQPSWEEAAADWQTLQDAQSAYEAR